MLVDKLGAQDVQKKRGLEEGIIRLYELLQRNGLSLPDGIDKGREVQQLQDIFRANLGIVLTDLDVNKISEGNKDKIHEIEEKIKSSINAVNAKSEALMILSSNPLLQDSNQLKSIRSSEERRQDLSNTLFKLSWTAKPLNENEKKDILALYDCLHTTLQREKERKIEEYLTKDYLSELEDKGKILFPVEKKSELMKLIGCSTEEIYKERIRERIREGVESKKEEAKKIIASPKQDQKEMVENIKQNHEKLEDQIIKLAEILSLKEILADVCKEKQKNLDQKYKDNLRKYANKIQEKYGTQDKTVESFNTTLMLLNEENKLRDKKGKEIDMPERIERAQRLIFDKCWEHKKHDSKMHDDFVLDMEKYKQECDELKAQKKQCMSQVEEYIIKGNHGKIVELFIKIIEKVFGKKVSGSLNLPDFLQKEISKINVQQVSYENNNALLWKGNSRVKGNNNGFAR